MATQQVPARTITVCDVCKREAGYLTECIACGREYCLVCGTTFPGCMVAPKVCHHCPRYAEVQAVCDRHAPKIAKIVQKRDAEIAALRHPQTTQITRKTP